MQVNLEASIQTIFSPTIVDAEYWTAEVLAYGLAPWHIAR